MIPQDITLSISSPCDNGAIQPGQLKGLHNSGNVTLSFFRELPETKKYSQFPEWVHPLGEFTMIQNDPKNSLHMTVSGSRTTIHLYFGNDVDFSIFQKYLGSKVRLRMSVCNPLVYILEPPDENITSIPPYSGTILPQPFGHSTRPKRISLQMLQKKGLVFKTESDVSKLTSSDFKELFDEDGKVKDVVAFSKALYNKDIDRSLLGEIFQLLTLPDFTEKTRDQRDEFIKEKREIYKKVKLQWQLVTFNQWKNYPELREVVDLLESDLIENEAVFSHFEHPNNVQTVAFNVLLTLSIWNHDEALYSKDMFTYVLPFINSFIQDAPDENTISLHNNEQVDTETVEADIFWCFTYFFDNNKISEILSTSNMPKMNQLFSQTGIILEKYLPELLQLLYQKHAHSLDFILHDCCKWFTTCFQTYDIVRLWITTLSFTFTTNILDFNKFFISSLLYSLAPLFIEMNPLNSEDFINRFDLIKKEGIDLNLVLVNSEKLMEIIQQPENNTPSTS